MREFLASRRAKITPEQAGLTVYGKNRRVTGLRREEVAMLAGISVEYYTRLERGNANGASEDVLEGIARALQLDEAERSHLFDLARSASTTRVVRRRPSRRTGTPERSANRRRAHRDARRRTQRTPRHPLLQPTRTSPLHRRTRRQHAPDERCALHLPQLTLGRVLRRLERHSQRRSRHSPRRSRTRPLRPPTHRPHRRTLHTQRRVPRPLGRPQRQTPQHRSEDLPPSNRR